MDAGVAVTLLRHGMTAENERSAYIGWLDSALSKKGKTALYQLNSSFPQMDNLFSSDRLRCVETASILFPNQIAQQLPEIREMHFGQWEGKTYDELKGLPAYRNWLDSMFAECPDGGETFAAFKTRVLTGFRKIKQQMTDSNAKETAIVTHGGVIRLLLQQYAEENKAFFDWKFPYGGGYRLYWRQREMLRRNETCTLLQAVPTMANRNG